MCTEPPPAPPPHTHLSISPYGASAVGEQLGHVVVAAELPETGLQVEVPVEAQRAVPPQSAAELVGRRVSHALGAAGRGGDEAVARGDLAVVEQVGAAVVSHASPVGAESQVKVHERPSGDDRKHACETQRGEVIPSGPPPTTFDAQWLFQKLGREQIDTENKKQGSKEEGNLVETRQKQTD